MEKMKPVQPLFPHLPERLAGLEEQYIEKFYSKSVEEALKD